MTDEQRQLIRREQLAWQRRLRHRRRLPGDNIILLCSDVKKACVCRYL